MLQTYFKIEEQGAGIFQTLTQEMNTKYFMISLNEMALDGWLNLRIAIRQSLHQILPAKIFYLDSGILSF